VFFASLYLVSIGTGGVKSALLPFGADQYNDANLEESKRKQSFFSLFFIAINLGVFISGTVVVWIQQNVAWSLGFGISSVCLVIATTAFFIGTPTYRVQLPSGSPLKSIIMVFVASFKKREVEVPDDSSLLFEGGDTDDLSIAVPSKLEHTDEFRYVYHHFVMCYQNSKLAKEVFVYSFLSFFSLAFEIFKNWMVPKARSTFLWASASHFRGHRAFRSLKS
jgi:solute carrier family 15 (peptide/histidine transporter), member 3/4